MAVYGIKYDHKKCTGCRGSHAISQICEGKTPSRLQLINTTYQPRYPPKLTHSSAATVVSPLTLQTSVYPMALRLSIPSSHGPATSPAISPCLPAGCGRFPGLLGGGAASQKRSLTVMSGSETRVTPVRSSSLETATTGVEGVAVAGQVTEVNKDTFWPIVKAAGQKIVVLDMYTQWCGPCKVMAPKFQEMSEKNLDIVFLKLDCNQDNKSLAKELGIRVVPTFKIFRDGKVVKEVTGAKIDDLARAIETVKSS